MSFRGGAGGQLQRVEGKAPVRARDPSAAMASARPPSFAAPAPVRASTDQSVRPTSFERTREWFLKISIGYSEKI